MGNRFDMELKDGAACPGDYLYRSGSFGWDVESGMWGIFRVMKHSLRCRCKEMCGRIFRGRKYIFGDFTNCRMGSHMVW